MAIETQGIRYAGSKTKILHRIEKIANQVNPSKVLDGFSGSTRVSQLFKQMGYTVHSNDMAVYSKILAECFLLNKKEKSFYIKVINHLNSINGVDGWFTEHYGGYENNGSSVQEDGKKRPFQIHNTRKLDAIRKEIDIIYPTHTIEKSVLLTSLLLALDKVQNDLGHQVSYLKEWSSKSYNNLLLEVPNFFIDNKKHKVFNKDIFSIDENYDLAYLDPPYGTSNTKTPTSRVRYFSYYHLWTTIIKNDEPELFGAAKRREDVSSDSKEGAVSVFESTNNSIVENSFVNLLNTINSKFYLISYSNRSKVPINRLLQIIDGMPDMKVEDVLMFSHSSNSQANSLINGKYKTEYDTENLEVLLLLKK